MKVGIGLLVTVLKIDLGKRLEGRRIKQGSEISMIGMRHGCSS